MWILEKNGYTSWKDAFANIYTGKNLMRIMEIFWKKNRRESCRDFDENPRTILISYLEGFWWESWNDSDKMTGTTVMRIQHQYRWNPKRILMRIVIVDSDEDFEKILMRILGRYLIQIPRIFWQASREDENPERNVMRILGEF